MAAKAKPTTVSHARSERTSAATLPRLVVTVEQAAEILSVSRDTVFRMLRRNELRSVRISEKLRRIPMSALQDYIAARLEEQNSDGHAA